MSDHDQLEQRLQAARGTFDEVTVSPDAWQQNQRRLVADRARRSRPVLGAVAAAAAVIVLAGGVALLGSDEPDAGPPATTDGSDEWAPRNWLGPPVILEQLVVGGVTVDHEGVLTDTTGEGPVLCDRAEGDGFGFGACTRREEGADKPGVAVDWLMGAEGDGSLRTVLAGVDARVTLVNVHMSDGTKAPTALKPTGWERTQMFAYTVPADGPRPQRLVAYGRDGSVLQAVDLSARFGDGWLRERSACAGDALVSFGAQPTTPGDVFAAVGTTDAKLSAISSTGVYGDRCVERLRGTALAGWFVEGDRGVAVVAPEVDSVRLLVGGSVQDLASEASTGTMWKVAVLQVSPGARGRAEIVAYDSEGTELDREFLDQPVSP